MIQRVCGHSTLRVNGPEITTRHLSTHLWTKGASRHCAGNCQKCNWQDPAGAEQVREAIHRAITVYANAVEERGGGAEVNDEFKKIMDEKIAARMRTAHARDIPRIQRYSRVYDPRPIHQGGCMLTTYPQRQQVMRARDSPDIPPATAASSADDFGAIPIRGADAPVLPTRVPPPPARPPPRGDVPDRPHCTAPVIAKKAPPQAITEAERFAVRIQAECEKRERIHRQMLTWLHEAKVDHGLPQ